MLRFCGLVVFLCISLNSHAQMLILEQSDCDPSSCVDPYIFRERVIIIEVINDTLIIKLAKREACCSEFKGYYTISGDTLQILYSSKDACLCACFYQLTFKIPSFARFELVTFNGLQFKQSDQEYSEFVVRKDTLPDGTRIISNFENGELISEREHTDSTYTHRSYYQGKLQSEHKIDKREFLKKK